MKNTKKKSKKSIMGYLRGIYGIGTKNALRICDHLGLCPQNLYFQLSPLTQDRIYFYISENFLSEKEYKNIVKNDIYRYIEISCYRGIRHSRSLPCRGQRTHGNAKTVRKLSLYKK